MTRIVLAALASTALAGCAPIEDPTANQRALAEARPIGPPVDCVTVTDIRYTRVRDDSTIDFYLRGGRVYRNRLPLACPGLAFDERFSYRVNTSRLCSVDTITVFSTGGIRGPSCGLGRFQPIQTAAR